MTAAPLHPNYRYMLSWTEEAIRRHPGARILDFGCGAGEFVEAARRRGWEVSGADVFTGEFHTRRGAEDRGLLGGGVVREIRDGRLPFEDEAFDLVVSNTVFEHVEDLDGALSEIRRVLRPGGSLVAFFPSREVIREGHFGVPFLHRLPRDSGLRRSWALFGRSLGLATHTEGRSADEWARHALDWIDRFTFYRPRSEILATFGRGFTASSIEDRFVRFRLALLPRLGRAAPLIRIPWVAAGAKVFCRLWGGLVLLARKEAKLR